MVWHKMKCGYIQCSSTPLFCHSSVHWSHHLVVSLPVDSRGPLKSRYTDRESTFFCIDNVYKCWNANFHSVTCDLIFIATHHALLWIVKIYDPVTHQKELRKHSPVGGLVTCQLSILLSKIVFVNFSREPMNTACHLAGLHWLIQSVICWRSS